MAGATQPTGSSPSGAQGLATAAADPLSSSASTASTENSSDDAKASNAKRGGGGNGGDQLAVLPSSSSDSESGKDSVGDEKKQTQQTDPSSKGTDPEKYAYNPGDRKFEYRDLREHWYQFWRYTVPPPAPPLRMEDAPILPYSKANPLSVLTYQWVTPIMTLGYRRPLEATDLWKMDEKRSAEVLSKRLSSDWERRVQQAEEANKGIENGSTPVGKMRKLGWQIAIVKDRYIFRKKEAQGMTLQKREELWRAPPPPGAYDPPVPPMKAKKSPKGSPAAAAAALKRAQEAKAKKERLPNLSGHKRASLIMAVHDQMAWLMWSGLAIKLVGDVAQLTAPLVIRQIITFGQKTYAYHRDPANTPLPPPIGEGIGLAFALFFMQIISSLFQHQFFFRSMSVGVFTRAALISAIFTRGLQMNGKDRAPGKLTNHISTDVSRIDFASNWFTLAFSAPVQIIICLIILLKIIGPSALAGFAILVLAAPFQTFAMAQLFKARRQSMVWTDKRAKGIAEILASMRIVKSFSFEPDFLDRLHTVRTNELRGIRTLMLIRSASNAVAFSLPVLAAVLAFVTYSLTGHDLNAANIFTALTLFQLLRMPLMFLPLTLSATTDAVNAFRRLQAVFEAPVVKDTSIREPDQKVFGLKIEDATFRWEEVKAEEAMGSVERKVGSGDKATAVAGANNNEKEGSKNGLMSRLRNKSPARDSLEKSSSAAAAARRASLVEHVEEETAVDRMQEATEATATETAIGPQLADLTEEEKARIVEEQEGNVGQDSFVHPDDSTARDAKDTGLDPSRAPRDAQVSGIGAAKALFGAATSSSSSSSPASTLKDDNRAQIAAVAAGVEPIVTRTASNPAPFRLEHVNLTVAKGELLAIVGPVGSGKSSLLEGCIGEMVKEGGKVTWGGERVGYCPQTAWIQSATLRDNILFGQPFDEERYWDVIRVAELESDLEMLAAGDMSEIGEKGVTLSGGQKQRVNIARALYFSPDIYFFDDPLSALDAHVGKAVFHNAILSLRKQGKTVVLVTHALHFLPMCDRIVTMEDGRIMETGTYEELSDAQGPFSRLVAEFGGIEEEEEEVNKELEESAIEDAQGIKERKRAKMTDAEAVQAAKAGLLIEKEERNTGSVSGHVYSAYFKAGKGWLMVPLTIISLSLMQVATILNSYWLVWWQEDYFNLSQGVYMAVYAALAIAQTIATFLMGATTGYLSFYACKNLHRDAIRRIMYAPMAWFDVTPAGRIMNRMAKDIDVVDNQLADAFRMCAATISNVLGAVILITVLTHYFVVAVAVILVFYWYGAVFYRSSAREVKRLDAVLRSSLYSHFSESLSGISTLRAYRVTDRFLRENYKRMDDEDASYYITIVNQRWLGVRLDFLGAILILVVALLTTAGAKSIAPGQVGVALTYVVTTAQAFSWMTRQVAEVENNMNSAERILHYAEALDQEAPQERRDAQLPESWPDQGAISINNVVMRYRAGLPPVLKGISLNVKGGQKVGIVGRTGAGKSSLLTALLRLTEIESGSIVIDGKDISQLGLRDLRRRVAILPQDPLLFSGTMRSNLDPFGQFDDARLWDALKRATLVSDTTPNSGSATPLLAQGEKEQPQKQNRFTLDSPIDEGGTNLSLGQRSLVSLARALVKDSQIILLDEATASADSQTDARVQATIREEFASRTLLCIAHRLRTIIGYDRIAVLHQGAVAEYATPLELFDKEDGIFHDMCTKANITRADVVAAAPPSK